MKVSASKLSDRALDWAVLKSIFPGADGGAYWITQAQKESHSTDWSLSGPIIERERIEISVDRSDAQNKKWYATIEQDEQYLDGEGPTPLVAAMRCFVASKLGYEVEVPEGLV